MLTILYQSVFLQKTVLKITAEFYRMIELQNISLQLNDRKLFDKLSVEVPAGGRLLILGGSGSGKTTLLRMLLGFVLPDSGKILIDGEELTLENVWSLRQKMAYVSQEMQIGRGKAETFIKEVFKFRNNRKISYDRSKVLSLLEDFQLNSGTLDKDLEEISGGELQRFAIIVTLLLDRKIYLMDEATSALDEPLKKLIVSYFDNMDNKTLIISSHDNVWHKQNYSILNLEEHGSST
ncbi:MAG: ATP-binding cassette domain-containing protein [Bacteroidetes bacterium]|nr:MAG: ATP-binding cassette domain-containing protein [Bacteroidota bacterium]